MKNMCLDGNWNLYFHIEDKNLPNTFEDVKKRKWDRIEAVVPGNVELDLVRAGVEKDPFFGENIYDYRKYEFYQWWFERTFDIPPDFVEDQVNLVLNGIDTFGTIWINDLYAGETSNMLIEHVIDIKELLKIGESNSIVIRIKSSVNMVRNEEYSISVKGGSGIDEMVRIRKPPHCFGWDIAPRFLSAGIWRSILIETKESIYIKQVYYATRSINSNNATLVSRFRFATDSIMIDDYSVRINGVCGEHSFSKEFKTKFCSDECIIIIDSPKLWWPKGYGEQNLYSMTFELLHKGEVVAKRCEKIGIRIVEIKTSYLPKEQGEFKILVNECPIMAKGSNWVPLDAFHSRDKDRLKEAHNLLDDLGCNIVRCWGGNVYEDHDFYKLCDERGIMVWQDFSLACGIYPQEDGFLDQIRKEAISVIKKLRNHASIIFWAGDNEVDMYYVYFASLFPHARYNKISRELLPRAVGEHDPFRAYLPSSPYIPENHTDIHDVPEQHNWGSRDYYKGDYYKNTSAHFISEIGYHGCPSVDSIKKFISQDKLWPFHENSEWDTHSTLYRDKVVELNRNELMEKQVDVLFGEIPNDLDDFVLASQISQAEAKKFFIEMVRLKKWRRTGIIWWNLLDCWPQVSDSVVDYYFTKKIAYHYIKRVQYPICIMIAEIESWEYKVVLGNDSRDDAIVKYRIYDADANIKILSGEKTSKANQNIDIAVIEAIPGEQKLYLIDWEINGKKYRNHYISGYVPIDINKYQKWLPMIMEMNNNRKRVF